MRDYGQQVEDFDKEESYGGDGGFERVPVFRQKDIPIYDERQHGKKIRTFWFVPMAREGKKGEYDWDKAVTPAWRFYQHYVPLPAGGDKKGFVTVCSGNHDLLLKSGGAVDPDNCEVCKYAEANPIAAPKRNYLMVGFNMNSRNVEIEEWIEQGRNEGERRKAADFPAKLWAFQMGSALFKEISKLREKDKALDNCLHRYRVELKKIFDGPNEINVHYEAGFNEDDLKDPPEFNEMEWTAIRAFAEGTTNAKGEHVFVPNISYLVEPTPLDRQLKKLAELDRYGRRSESYAENRFGEDRKPQRQGEKEPAAAATGSGRFGKRFGKDEEEESSPDP